MLLRNFDMAILAATMNTNIPDGVRDPNGVKRTVKGTLSSAANPVSGWGQLLYGNECVVFGDGNAAPDYNDYCLSGNRVTGLGVTQNVTRTCENGQICQQAVYTITNNNSSSVTIGEIGVKVYITYVDGSSSGMEMFIERTALEAPVVIDPSGTAQITYTLTAPVPAWPDA